MRRHVSYMIILSLCVAAACSNPKGDPAQEYATDDAIPNTNPYYTDNDETYVPLNYYYY